MYIGLHIVVTMLVTFTDLARFWAFLSPILSVMHMTKCIAFPERYAVLYVLALIYGCVIFAAELLEVFEYII